MTGNPFEHERDARLGDLLRETLAPGDHAGFVRAVMVRIAADDDSWAVLGRWARPGIAAAIAFLLGMTLWLAFNPVTDAPSLAEAILPGDAPETLFSSVQMDNEMMLQVVLER